MPNQTKSNDTQSHGAHSGTRKGASDYNDGANVTDQLGNDEQNHNFGTFESGGDDAQALSGKVALGNNVEAEGEEDDQESKPETLEH